ncbi:hypothetical protein UlMin_043938 [Ulmus minor]
MEKAALASNRSPPSQISRSFCTNNYSSKPIWLLSTLSDLEERMKKVAINPTEDENWGDNFAERAESYYRKRPQLLALLEDLYNAYVTLSDRYIQSQPKNHHRRHSSQLSCMTNNDSLDDQQEEFSDAESSLSYQQPLHENSNNTLEVQDAVVAELVMKNVEFHILFDELNGAERRICESSRKIELQKSLLEVLESERLILLNENTRLGYRVGRLVEENKGLASESMFMKRKAGELARCVFKMREEQRVGMLSGKIEDLQAQIFGLEKRNKEYYEQLLENKSNAGSYSIKKNENGNDNDNDKEVSLETCFQVKKLNMKLMRNAATSLNRKGNGKKVSSLWKKVTSLELFRCGVNESPS